MANYTKGIYETSYGQSLLQERGYGWESTPFDRSNRMYSAFDYLLYSKTQNIINEFIQIRAFINELERYGFWKSKIHNTINRILKTLESNIQNQEHIRTVDILSKYLEGIKKFLETTSKKSVVFYKRLIESTLVAIMQDLYPAQRNLA